MAAVAYFFLPVSADKARFLTAEEALVAKARAVRQVGDVERVGGIVLKDILSTLADPKAWFTAVWVFPDFHSDSNTAIFIDKLRQF